MTGDDSLGRLTSVDVRQDARNFKTVMRGLDKAQVENYLLRVSEELERLAREKQDLEQKARNFHEQLRAFRERDKALSDALVSAQQLRAETREAADREAQLIIREAQAEGERIVSAAHAEARRLSGELEALERSKRVYIAQLRSVIERQLVELDAVSGVNASQTNANGGASTNQGPAGSDRPPARPNSQTPSWLDTVVKE